MQRDKGKVGERELAALLTELTGHDVRRRVRQHEGDSDLEGLPGWSVECKRYRSAAPADVSRWWAQAAAQASREGTWPVLFYRLDKHRWRCVWPADLHTGRRPVSVGFDNALVSDPLVWWRMCHKYGPGSVNPLGQHR
jgi:Holliday junction resolvase